MRGVWLALAATVWPLAAFESQSAFDVSLIAKERVEWDVHSRFRTRSQLSDLYQVRAGTFLDLDLRERISLVTGYLLLNQERDTNGWDNFHRVFGGARVEICQGKTGLDSRTLFERFIARDETGYNRYRQRFRVMKNGLTVSPYGSVEWLARTGRLESTRLVGGVRWRPAHNISIDLGYLFEARWGGQPDRHSLITSFHFGKRTRREDADP